MIVKYNKQGILSLPVPEVKRADEKNSKFGKGAVKVLILKPGINPRINDADWERVSKNPLVKKKIDAKIIVPMPSKLKEIKKPEERKKIEDEIQKEKSQGACKDLAEYNAEDAIAIVKDTYDVNVLTDWSFEEKRSTVTRVISEKIAKITKREEPKK